jgi:ankyrin repeat protein
MHHKNAVALIVFAGILFSGCSGKEKNELIEAVANGEFDRTQMLLDTLPSPDFRTFDGDTPLALASERGHPDIVELLINRGANVNFLDGSGNSALFYAAMSGCNPCAVKLIEKGATFRTNAPLASVLEKARRHPNTMAILQEKGLL